MKEMKHKLHERKDIEELLNAKIATLELNNKHNEEVFQQLQNEYDTLCKRSLCEFSLIILL